MDESLAPGVAPVQDWVVRENLRNDPSSWRLYGIFDLAYAAEGEAERVCSEMCEGGVDVIQLRAKGWPVGRLGALAGIIRRITASAGRGFVVNDHPELARDSGADAVHVGQEDLPVAAARDLSGGLLVGRSTHSLEQARAAVAEGADYIGFGPLFATQTKPDYKPTGLDDVARVHAEVRLPIFCIGGIKVGNLRSVLAAGARRVVVVSGILLADDIVNCCREICRMLEEVAGGNNRGGHVS